MKTAFACAVTLTLIAASPLTAQRSEGPFRIEEMGESFWRLDDAVKAIGDQEATIVIAPGTYKDCAIQSGGSITYRAAKAGSVIFDGGVCDGKAALVLDGTAAVVDGLIFQNMRVPDRNGSGIRHQKGDLTVVNSLFRNSEQGILTHDDQNGTLTVDHTSFSGLGGCPDGVCSHSIYAGRLKYVRVTNTRFDRGTGGHYLKSRAVRTDVSDSSFDDTQGRETNYMIDLSVGSTGTITRNVFVQGRNKENYSAFIAVSPEGREHRSGGLIVTNNRASIAPGVDRNTIFVADWSHEPLRISANQIGPGLRMFETR